MNVLDQLLKLEPQNLPEKLYEIKRLSEACGEPVIFKLRALPYSRVADIRKNTENMSVHIVLAGVVEPNFGDVNLKTKHNALLPTDVVTSLLLPGEIDDLAIAIERLSGFRVDVIEEIKKK